MRRRVVARASTCEQVVEMHGLYVAFAEKLPHRAPVIDFDVRGRAAYFSPALAAVHELYPGYDLAVTMEADHAG